MAHAEAFDLPDDLFYEREDHLWLRIEGEQARVGLDQFGQKMAGRVAYIKLLPAGRSVQKGRSFGSLEAGKYIGPLKAPVSGRLIAANGGVLAKPELVNTDPYGEGWLVLIEPSNLATDLSDLAHGAEVQPWLDDEVAAYRARGLTGGQS